ncbi:hypothetical protein [Sphaerisporangium siamense]|uniref:Uncharacterized protein n=1 Tax=Sphaerisporangium siamense TaxID=795645 RepID=A0A7W7D1Y7_9ACTN|nr:hypothetical protein [Sphaerisporangium siamense]MBB4698727.1 hypothetical protein [Sphaerisporangium siamense]
MTQGHRADPMPRGYTPMPLTSEEEVRFQRNMSEWVREMILTKGSVSVSADTEQDRRRWQEVAHHVGEMLGQPVVSYATPWRITITVDRGERQTSLGS